MSLSLKQIDSYIDALLGNAQELIFEADTLYKAKLYPRAYALAHFSREELSKCLMLYATGARILYGEDIDWKDTMKRLRDHKSNLRLETVHNAIFAAAMGEEESSSQMARNVQFHAEYRNNRKNASLYVGLDEGVISLPSEVVSERQAWRTIELAKGAFDHERSLWEALGPFDSMKPGSPKKLTDPKSLNAESPFDLINKIAPLYGALLEHLKKEKESNN